jgi:hypothetical protein
MQATKKKLVHCSESDSNFFVRKKTLFSERNENNKKMNFGWILFLLIGVLLVIWRRPLFGYLEGRPYLSDELRRYINRQTAGRPTILITDNVERDRNWSQDLNGVTALTPDDFIQDSSGAECVVSIADERRMTRREREALYSKLGQVPFVLRIRNRTVASTPDMRDMDDSGDRRLVTGSLVFRYHKPPV